MPFRPLDGCACGDWRRSHLNGGRCGVVGCACSSFRIVQSEAEYAAAEPAHYAALAKMGVRALKSPIDQPP